MRAAGGRRVPGIATNASGRVLAAWSVLLLALAGCGQDDQTSREPTGAHARPTTAGECSDLPHVGGDGGVVLGTDWSTETHAYDRPVDLTVCVTTAGGGRVRVQSSDAGIAVTPRSLHVPREGNGLLTVQVRVASGTPSGGTLRVEQYGGGVGGAAAGPSIATTADGWHFT